MARRQVAFIVHIFVSTILFYMKMYRVRKKRQRDTERKKIERERDM